jgi:hypothetical protein
MLSWPPATTILASPAMIDWAATATARRPEPQTWLRPQAGTSFGTPAAIEAWRAGFWPWPAVSTWPRITSDTSSGATRPGERGFDRDAAELVAGRGGEGAEEGADGGALGGGDDDVGHGKSPAEELARPYQLAPRRGKAMRRAAPKAPRARGCRRPCRHGPDRARAARRPRWRWRAGTIRSVVETMLRRGRGGAGIDRLGRRRATRRAGQILAEEASNISRARLRDRRPVIGPVLQRDEGSRFRARIESGEALRTCATVRAGSRLQKALCSTSIGSRPSERAVGRCAPRACRASPAPRRREAGEMPGRGDGGDGAHLRKRGSGERHGAAEAIADQRRRLSSSRDEGEDDLLDMAGDGEVRRASTSQPQSSSSTRWPRAASQRSSDFSALRSSTLGGLISEGMNRTGGPSPP